MNHLPDWLAGEPCVRWPPWSSAMPMKVSPGLQQRHEHRLVGLRAGVRLHVGERAVEQLAGAVDGELLGLVDVLAAAVVAPAGIALGVFVGQHRARRLEHRARDDVLRGDQLDLLALAVQLALERPRRSPDRPRRGCGVNIGSGDRRLGGGLSSCHFDPSESLATRPAWRPPSNSVARKTFSASRAVSVPIRRWPNATTLASLCSRDNRADVTSWARAARTLGLRLAAIEMPMPVPQTRTPRLGLAGGDGVGHGLRRSPDSRPTPWNWCQDRAPRDLPLAGRA